MLAIESFPRGSPVSYLLMRTPVPRSAVLIIFAVVIVVSWLTSKDIGFLWLRVLQRAEMARMGTFRPAIHPTYDRA